MILHDHWCKFCGTSFEALVDWDKPETVCPNCGHIAQRYYRSGCANTNPVDAAWIKTIREVVDKDSKKPHVTEFLRHPTRDNYHKWMAGEKIRPIEPGEKLHRPDQIDLAQHVQKIMERRIKANRIEI